MRSPALLALLLFTAVGAANAADASSDKDWLLEALLGTRRIYARSGPAAAASCERYKLVPAGELQDHRGRAVLDEADPAPDATTFELAYEGYPPRLTAPKARLDKHVLPLACGAEQQGQWFFERFACEDPDAVPRIEPRGCLGALSAAARDRARKVLAGGPRDEFLALLRKTGNVWIPNVGISKGACRQFTLKPGKDRLVLFPLDGDHSHEIKLLDGGAISFGEAFDDNPHAKKSRSRDSGIALGCCSKPTSYRVLSVDAGTARLQAPDREVTWAFSRRTCKPE